MRGGIPVSGSDGIIKNVTLSAAIEDDMFSFRKDELAQTCSVTFDEIQCGETGCELLQLYPQANFKGEEKIVTVTLTLSAPGLDTLTETCPLKIRRMPDDSVQEHLDFYNKNVVFRTSMRNYYGHEAALLAADPEYLWSRISTFDIDNYYKIVVADLITGMLQAQQFSLPNLIPEVVKNWTENLKTLKDGLKTIINDDYTEQFDISETALDQFLDTMIKGSKYTDQAPTKDKDLFHFLLKRIDSAAGQEKLRKVFAAADKTSQILGMIKFGKNIVEDCLDCVTKITLLETFYDADEDFKAVVEMVRNKASESGKTELVKAFDEYLRFDSTKDGTMLSYLPTILETSGKITQDAFKSIIGKKMIDYIGAKTLVWVGKNTILASGKALNTLAGFSTFSSAMGGVFLGGELGLCLSDILCDSDTMSKEMAKAVHMGELSTLLVQTLADAETELVKNKDSTSLRRFEYAFRLHKSAQSYIMDHLTEAMKAKRYSVLTMLLGKQRSMQEDIESLLVLKGQIDDMTCHKDVKNSSKAVEIWKCVYVHCPVDVLILDTNGETALCIESDEIITQEERIVCVILDGEKYILLPGDTEYSIQINATDNGQMWYSVREYKGIELQAIYENKKISLKKDQIFMGNITDGVAKDENSYDLHTDAVRIPVEKAELSAVIPGDVDGDGNVTAADARLALRRAVELETYPEGSAEYLACDVDHDGKVTAGDARVILRAAVGLESLN